MPIFAFPFFHFHLSRCRGICLKKQTGGTAIFADACKPLSCNRLQRRVEILSRSVPALSRTQSGQITPCLYNIYKRFFPLVPAFYKKTYYIVLQRAIPATLYQEIDVNSRSFLPRSVSVTCRIQTPAFNRKPYFRHVTLTGSPRSRSLFLF